MTLPPLPALVVGTVSHHRRVPRRHGFTHDHYWWLVDLADLPRWRGPTRWLSRFSARDHLDGGRLGHGIRGDLVRWLAGRGVEISATDRVLMLAHARTLGHVFDPLSVFLVLDPAGRRKALVLEVHNTYGERHAYLVDADQAGRAVVAKEFYVSPFNDTSGHYRLRVELTADRVQVEVGLEREGERVLTAVVTGRPQPATPSSLRRVFARHLFMTRRVTWLIRYHGIRLWLARLPVHPRPTHSQEAVR